MNRRSVFIIVLFLLQQGCSKDSSPSAPVEKPTEKNFLELAWKNFESQHYDSAVIHFTEAYNKATTANVRGEAIAGRGWANAYARDLSKAKSDFAFALNISGLSNDLQTDIRAGTACVLYGLNDFAGTLSFAQPVLADKPTYVFAHDPKVTAKRIRLLMIQSYYATGQFTQAADHMNILDPSGAPHSIDPAILLGKIQAALNSL